MQSIENKVITVIYGKGRGWAFSQNDFAKCGSRDAIDKSFSRIQKKGTIRRVIRGLYDYPTYSDLLKKQLSPDIDQVAHALARKFSWRIQPTGQVALNVLGLTTQVPGKFTYLSDGPERVYKINKVTLSFNKAPLKESGFKLAESSLIVQALKCLGQEHIKPKTITALRKWLPKKLRPKVLKETSSVTGWIYSAIGKICKEDSHG